MSRTRRTPRPTTDSGEALERDRSYLAPQHYRALLLKAIRDGVVDDWHSLRSFQTQHQLGFVVDGSRMVGEAPAVIPLLNDLQNAGLVIVEGIGLGRIWVRRDNFKESPPGRVVYDPADLDPTHRLEHPEAIPITALSIKLAPHWKPIEDVLGISLSALAALQHPSARIVAPDVFPEPSQRQNYDDVFVAMPFDPTLKPVYERVRKACKKVSVSAKRGNDFFTAHAVMADVWGAIQNARIVVADCTDRNPNVFYEIGLAHVLAKPVVLLSQREEDVPFDLRQIRRIPYQNTQNGLKALEESLGATLRALLR